MPLSRSVAGKFWKFFNGIERRMNKITVMIGAKERKKPLYNSVADLVTDQLADLVAK